MSERKNIRPHDWESYAEALIRAAQEAGEFDNLPGFGQPIPSIDEPHDENWWVREKLKREGIKLNVPPPQWPPPIGPDS
ncbi:MAG: DUF1992 domain-containing protein [Pirellulaceae bacterium]